MTTTDSSANARRTDLEVSQSPNEVRLVWREHVELFRLEQLLPHAKDAEQRYNILSDILTREIPIAKNIREPDINHPLHGDYAKDIADIAIIERKFATRRIPVPKFPQIVPLTGKSRPEYDVSLDGYTPLSTVLQPDMPLFLDRVLSFALQNAFEVATQPLRNWWSSIRSYLVKYGIWDLRTEVNAGLSGTSEADIDRQIGEADSYAKALTARSHSSDSRADYIDTESVEVDDEADPDIDKDPYGMD